MGVTRWVWVWVWVCRRSLEMVTNESRSSACHSHACRAFYYGRKNRTCIEHIERMPELQRRQVNCLSRYLSILPRQHVVLWFMHEDKKWDEAANYVDTKIDKQHSPTKEQIPWTAILFFCTWVRPRVVSARLRTLKWGFANLVCIWGMHSRSDVDMHSCVRYRLYRILQEVLFTHTSIKRSSPAQRSPALRMLQMLQKPRIQPCLQTVGERQRSDWFSMDPASVGCRIIFFIQ